MRKLTEQTTKVSHVLAGTFRDLPTQQRAADIAEIKVQTLNKKRSGSPVEVRGTDVAELIAWAEDGLITSKEINALLAGANIVSMRADPAIKLRLIQTLVAGAMADITKYFEDGKFDDAEKRDFLENGTSILEAVATLMHISAQRGVTEVQ